MEQAIYGDLYFAVNFTMDTLALFLTSKLLRRPPKWGRLTVAGTVGAVYSVGALFLPDGNLLSLISTLMMPALICIIALGWQGFRPFVRALGTFWAISMLLGGSVTAVCYAVGLWAGKAVSVGGKVQPLMGDLPFWGLLLAALLIGAGVSFFLKTRKPTVQSVEIIVEAEGTVCLSALVDSGNLLTEPISGLPVVVADREKIAAILPEALRQGLAAESGASDKGLHTAGKGAELRVRLIPCTTPSGEGVLYGFLPKRLTVAGVPKEACVAIGEVKGEYAAIVPSNLL